MPQEATGLWGIVLQGGAAGVLFVVSFLFLRGDIVPRWVLAAREAWEKTRDELWLAAVTQRDTEIASLKAIITNYAAMTAEFTQVLNALADMQRIATAMAAQVNHLQEELAAARRDLTTAQTTLTALQTKRDTPSSPARNTARGAK